MNEQQSDMNIQGPYHSWYTLAHNSLARGVKPEILSAAPISPAQAKVLNTWQELDTMEINLNQGLDESYITKVYPKSLEQTERKELKNSIIITDKWILKTKGNWVGWENDLREIYQHFIMRRNITKTNLILPSYKRGTVI